MLMNFIVMVSYCFIRPFFLLQYRVELGDMKPSMEHYFFITRKSYITLKEFIEEFATMK
jgi:hypothetical protein